MRPMKHALSGPGTGVVALTVAEDRFGSFKRGPMESSQLPGVIGALTEQTDVDQLTFSGRMGWSAALGQTWRLAAGASLDRVEASWVQSLRYELPGLPDYTFRYQQPKAEGLWFSGWLEVGWTGVSDLSVTAAKTVFAEIAGTDKAPVAVVEALGLRQVSDDGALREAVRGALAANAQAVADYRAGNERTFGFLVGQAMKATRGQGAPALVSAILREELEMPS